MAQRPPWQGWGTAIGLALGATLVFAVATIVASSAHTFALKGSVYATTRGLSLRLEPPIVGAAVGGLLGLFQWRALRPVVSSAIKWVGITAIATGAAWAAFRWVMRPALQGTGLESGTLGNGLIFGAIWGALAGGAQWLMLRQTLRNAHLWWLATAAGLGLAMAAGQAMGSIAGLAAACLIQGSVMGLMLAWVSQASRQPPRPALGSVLGR